MAEKFGATSTADEVLSGINLKGKRFLITGASSGIGLETARSLVSHGASVVGAVRNLTKAELATASVRDAASQGGSLELINLDLASLQSVRACADKLLADGQPFDAIIANAGVMATPFGRTIDNFDGGASWTRLSDFGAYEQNNNPDGQNVDTNLYDLLIADNIAYVVDAGANALLFQRAFGGEPTLETVFPTRTTTDPLTGEAVVRQPVPTSDFSR